MSEVVKSRINIAITAMGGQGGGVLADWVVSLAETAGWYAQTTSVPGVAQRTGATVYYLELFRRGESDALPVLSLSPGSGDVDLVMAAELMEAGRAIQRGFVTPDRTTLIASSHRAYAVTEKESLGNALADSGAVHRAAADMAQRYISFDMAALAEETGSVVSAVLFGAVFGSGVLPFAREAFEEAIRSGGVGVETSLAAFAAGAEHARVGSRPPEIQGPVVSQWHYHGSNPGIQALLQRLEREFPESLVAPLSEGIRRLLDHSGLRYATRYCERMGQIRDLDERHAGGAATGWRFSCQVASRLALWMAYEDTIRVADIKTRVRRFDGLYEEVGIDAEQVSYFREYLHPRIEEVAETLPAPLGRWVLRTRWASKLAERLLAGPKKVSTQSLGGFLSLYLVACLRPMRHLTLRDAIEQARIEQWLSQLEATIPADYDLACEVATLPELIKGYSKTRDRGLRVFGVLSAAAERLRGQTHGADILRQLKDAALRSEDGSELVAGLRSSRLGELSAMVTPGPGSGGVQVMTPEAIAT